MLHEEVVHILSIKSEQEWANEIFKIANKLGFDQVLFALLQSKKLPHEQAFIKSNYNVEWRKKYDFNRMSYYDPVVSHSCKSNTALFWNPSLFQQPLEACLLEEASSYGLRYGLAFPIHGPNGEVGLMAFSSEMLSNSSKNQHLLQAIPILSVIRDYAFESSLQFIRRDVANNAPILTRREIEILKWTMAGKSMWEISKIIHCSESNVNFHITNIRRKFGVSTKYQAIIQAVKLGIIEL